MDANVTSDRIAVLIDADNASHRQLQVVLGEVAKYGNPTIKRVYGDWTSDRLGNWAPKLNSLGLRAVHQNAFTKGKNSTDMALVIDAMDLLYDDNVESFALVTSDSDFTALTHRLRESGKAVYVIGTQKAPESLRNACDKFIDLDVLGDADDETEDDAAQSDASGAVVPAINLQSALTRALNAVSDDDGWASLQSLGNQLNRTHPSFDPRTFAGPGGRLSNLVADLPYLETTGSGNALQVRLKGAPAARRTTRKSAGQAKEPVEKPADKPVDKAAATIPADEPAAPVAEKKPGRSRARKKPAQAAAEQVAPEPAAVEPVAAEPAAAEKPAAKRTSTRKTAAKKAPAKKAAAAPAKEPEAAAPAAPVVRVTTRTRTSRRATPTTPASSTPAS